VDPSTLQAFANAIRVSSNSLGIRVWGKPPAFLQGNLQERVAMMTAEVMSKPKATFGAKPNIICISLYKANIPLFRAVKDSCNVTFGPASQERLVKNIILT
jgi:hypothetical protein